MPEVDGIDLDEALRLIRKHMQPGDTLGKMFMRVARALEDRETTASKWEIGKNGWDAADEATREDI